MPNNSLPTQSSALGAPAFRPGSVTVVSSVKYAVAPSWRMEGKSIGRSGHRVGFDVYEIDGHSQSGDVVYLTLRLRGWVRDRADVETLCHG